MSTVKSNLQRKTTSLLQEIKSANRAGYLTEQDVEELNSMLSSAGSEESFKAQSNKDYQAMKTEDGEIPYSVRMSGVMPITKKNVSSDGNLSPNELGDPVVEEGNDENELLSKEDETKKLDNDMEVELEVKSKTRKKKAFSDDELV